MAEEAKPAEELEVEVRAINAQPWEPLPGMVKRQCPCSRYFFAAPAIGCSRSLKCAPSAQRRGWAGVFASLGIGDINKLVTPMASLLSPVAIGVAAVAGVAAYTGSVSGQFDVRANVRGDSFLSIAPRGLIAR
jgi:hypothetical protein